MVLCCTVFVDEVQMNESPPIMERAAFFLSYILFHMCIPSFPFDVDGRV